MIRTLTFGRFADENFGGVERYTFELAKALRAEVALTNIVARRGRGPDIVSAAETLYARPLFYLAGAPVCPTMPVHAMRLHRRKPFDIVHLQFPADPMAHLSALAVGREARLVITWHSDIVRQKGAARLYWPFLRRLVSRADAIIAPTPAHFQSMVQLAALSRPEQRHVVPFGFDLERYRVPHPRATELRLKAGKPIVFALGRHVYYKGFEYLIRAMQSIGEAVLFLGGTGPLTASLDGLVNELGLQERVRLVGRISEQDLPAYYQACDVFCLPSVETAEAFGIVQVEAMAAGKPVLCTTLGNGVNWVNPDGITGVAAPPRDSKALADALNRLLQDQSLRNRLGRAAAERAQKMFSLNALRAGTLEVYHAVMRASQ